MEAAPNTLSPSLGFRILVLLAPWVLFGAAFAVFAPLVLEAGESEARVRFAMFVESPLEASFGLASALTQSDSPSAPLLVLTLVAFGLLIVGAFCCAGRGFYAFASVQALLAALSLLQMAKLLQYWNEHLGG